jgi:HK97 family phage major capsid protein
VNPAQLKNLWEQRGRVVDGLRSYAEKANPTAEDVQAEERMLAELKALDVKINKGLDEAEREERASESFKKYEHLMGGNGEASNPVTPDILLPNMSMADWAKRHGQSEGYEGRSFGRYLRDIIHSAPLEKPEYEARFVGEGGSGGNVVPTPLAADVIDLARNATRVIQAGAVTVPMTSQTLKYPRLTAEGSPAWHTEHASISDVDLTFDAITFTARTLTRLVRISMEMVDDAPEQAEGVIARSFAEQIALELDRAALRGSGTAPEPRGVLNTSGVTVTTHGANGSTLATAGMGYDFLLDAQGVVMGNNFTPNNHIVAPRSVVGLAKLKEATTNAYLAPPAMQLPMLPTKQVPINLTVGTSSDCSEVYTADWSQLLIGLRTELRILPLRERYADFAQYGFLAYFRADIQLAQPSAFVVDTGVRS